MEQPASGVVGIEGHPDATIDRDEHGVAHGPCDRIPDQGNDLKWWPRKCIGWAMWLWLTMSFQPAAPGNGKRFVVRPGPTVDTPAIRLHHLGQGDAVHDVGLPRRQRLDGQEAAFRGDAESACAA